MSDLLRLSCSAATIPHAKHISTSWTVDYTGLEEILDVFKDILFLKVWNQSLMSDMVLIVFHILLQI